MGDFGRGRDAAFWIGRVEMPTGNYDKGLGVGKVWCKVPLWLANNFGHWLRDGRGELSFRKLSTEISRTARSS